MPGISIHMRWQSPRMRAQSALPPKSNEHRQTIRSFLRQLKRTLRSNSQPYILQIPQEILDEIVKYLPLLYKACLATTCRSLYNRIGTVLQDPSLQHSYSFHNNHPFIKKREVEAKVRTQLIRTVGENSSWKFCLHCEKLHTRSTWKKPPKKECYEQLNAGLRPSMNCKIKVQREFDQVRNDRYYRANHVFATMTRPLREGECLPWAGVVEICPCLRMTYQNRNQMKDLLKSVSKSVGNGDPAGGTINVENVFCLPSGEEIDTILYHECTVRDHPFVMVKVRTSFYLKDDSLWVQSNYQVYVPWGKLPIEVQPPITYSQRQLRRWTFRFSRFLDDPNSQNYGSFRDWRARSQNGRRLDEFHLQLDRNLGKGRLPDKNWKECRVPRSGSDR